MTEGKLDPFRTVWFTVIMLVLYCAVLYLIMHAKDGSAHRRFSLILLAIVCAETFANGLIQTTSLDIDVSYSSYSSYNSYIDTVREISDKVQSMDDSFYRMEKTRMRKTNDNMALNMRGLSCSTSTLNKETIDFLKYMGYTSYSHRSKYMGETPLSDSLLGIKYVLSEKKVSESRADYHENRAIDALMGDLYTVFAETDDYVAYQNPYALSLAYVVSDSIKDFSFFELDSNGEADVKESSPIERLNAFVTALLGAEEDPVQVFVPIATDHFNHNNCIRTGVAEHAKYSVNNDSSAATISMTAACPKDAYVFFYAASDYPREVDLSVDGKKFGDFMASDSNRIKTLGYFEKDHPINVQLYLQDSAFYLKNDESLLYYLDTDVLETVMTALGREQFRIDEYTETHFTGAITTSYEVATVLTTIPYDEGWQIYVDGEKTEIFKAADALIAFDIRGAGEHTLEMRYSPKLVNIGALISLCSLLLFAAIVLTEYIVKHRREKILETATLETSDNDSEEPKTDVQNPTERN